MGREIEHFEDPKEVFLKQFSSLRPDLFYPEAWGEAEREKVSELVRSDKVKTNMFAAIPMVCRGDKCPVKHACPLFEQNIHPLGKKCPIEMAMVQQFFQDYVEELNVDVTRLVEVSMIRDLVDQEIQYMRKTNLLAKEDFIQDNVVGVTPDGKPLIRKELHQAVEMEDKIHRRKEKLRSQLLATRESRAKVGQGAVDTAQVVANLLEQVDEVNRARENLLRQKIGRDALYDDYIEAQEVTSEEED